MKKVAILLAFLTSSIFSFSQYAVPQNVKEDKELSKYVFNHINSYRDSIGVKPYIWTDFWYLSAKKWNDEVSTTGKWGHNRGPEWELFKGQEMIVAVPILSEKDNNYQFIADSALQQWLHSKYHISGIISPRQEKIGDTATVQFGDNQVSGVYLCKYGAISVNILTYANYKIAYVIFHLGYYPSKSEL
jgi:uncharacterized protein YkwD